MKTFEHGSGPTSPTRFDGDVGDDIWTGERIAALGMVTDLATTARIMRFSRSLAYDLAKRDQFPVPVLRFGSHYRVPVAAILRALLGPLR